jgi:hypothetical protein
MDPLAYYATQSPITDPGKNVGLFVNLPDDIEGLCRVVQGLYVHFHGLEHYGISDERLPEINTRYVEKMLARIVEMDDRPLTEPRSPNKRLVGCCHDADVLFCALSRHQGIPTRTRVGFASYLNNSPPDFNASHTVVEYWDLSEQRWRLVDVDQCWRVVGLDGFVPGEHDIGFDVYDVPRDQFLVAGKAWQMCRTDEADPNRFGLEGMKGLWFIRGNLILDLAAQNKMELLLWDAWGLMLKDMETYTEEEWQLLDKVAVLTRAGNEAFAEMRAIYEEEIGLKVPPVVKCYSPVGKPSEVTLPATAT